MGFSIGSLRLVRAGSAYWKGANVLSLGNPFLTPEILGRAGFDTTAVQQILSFPRNSRAAALFLDVFKAKEFIVLDISSEEEAELVLDLNIPVTQKKILGTFDAVLDLGTQEHVMNTNILMQNILNLLKPGGLYIFSLPANNFLEHGFRQYSPTFFYDLCQANKRELTIAHLSLHHQKLIRGISVLPLYEKMDPKFSEIADCLGYEFKSTVENIGNFTGSAIQVFNDLRGGVELMGAIKKNKNGQLLFTATQCLYRVLPLQQILPENTTPRWFRADLASFLKLLFRHFPAPAWLKIRSLVEFNKLQFPWVCRPWSRDKS